MKLSATLFRRLLPALLLAGLVLSSCGEHRKAQDPRPKGKCGSGPAAPGGNS